MTSNPIFRGAGTALITPTTEEGIDFPAFGKLIDWQIEQGIDALIVVGTSGECSTLNDDEHRAAIDFAVQRVNGRVPVICGTGSNDTAHAVAMSQYACQAGADGLLVVTPYYNKCTQKGLVKIFTTIADASTKPIIIYNVPSRTGVNIAPATCAVLADHPRIAAIKEASGNIAQIVETASLVEGRMDVYSGNDDQIVPVLSVGGAGVISVLSNLLPGQTSEMCRRFWDGDVAGAAKMQFEFFPLIKALFSEVNPIPAKAAMAAMGFCTGYVRLPMTPMEPENKEKLFAIMRKFGLIE